MFATAFVLRSVVLAQIGVAKKLAFLTMDALI
jgi:hypothetical protein